MREYYQTDYLKGIAIIEVDDNNNEKILFYRNISDTKFYDAFCLLKKSIKIDETIMKAKCDFLFSVFESLWEDYHMYISKDGVAYLFEEKFEDFYKKYSKYSSYEKKLLLRK